MGGTGKPAPTISADPKAMTRDLVFALYRLTCRALTGSPEALCSRAYRNRHHPLCALFVALVTEAHARASHDFWNPESKKP